MESESLEQQVRETFALELAEMSDAALRGKVVQTWVRAMLICGAIDLDRDLPSMSFLHDVEQPGFGVEHVRGVVQLAVGIAKTVTTVHRLTVDLDVVVAGSLLHDIGKLLEHAPRDRHALAGTLVGHAFSGVHLGAEAGLPGEVLHIIAYHAFEGQRRHRTLECEIVYRADFLSLDALVRRELGKTAGDFVRYVYLP